MELFKYLILTILLLVHGDIDLCNEEDIEAFLNEKGKYLKEFDDFDLEPNPFLEQFIKENYAHIFACSQTTQRFANQHKQKNISIACFSNEWNLLNHKNREDNSIEIEKVLLAEVTDQMIKCEGKP